MPLARHMSGDSVNHCIFDSRGGSAEGHWEHGGGCWRGLVPCTVIGLALSGTTTGRCWSNLSGKDSMSIPVRQRALMLIDMVAQLAQLEWDSANFA